MMRGKLRKYLAVLLLSGALSVSAAYPALAAEADPESETVVETGAESGEETETESASEEATEAESTSEAVSEAESTSGAAETEIVSEELQEEETTAADSTEEVFKQSAAALIQQIMVLSDEEIAYYMEQGDSFLSGALASWQSTKGTTGAFVSIDSQTVEQNGTTLTVVSQVTCENAPMTVTLHGDFQANAYTGMTFEAEVSLGQVMTRAAMNTVIGLVVVFAVLFFLSYVIGLLKHVNVLDKKEPEAEPETPEIPFETAAGITEEEELADDAELVAVIAAAIAAYEGSASPEGFVVRSIRKSKNNRWRRA